MTDTVYRRLDALEATVLGISTTELGFLDGVTAGTAAASKALVLNSSSGITTGLTLLTATTGAFGTLSGAPAFSGLPTFKVTNAITAFATGGQASATALVSTINSITTCATAGDSVKLPAALAGSMVQVSNLGAAYANVFPASGDLIDTLAANASVKLGVGSSMLFTCAVAGSWKSLSNSIPNAKFTTGTTTTTFAAGQLTGGRFVNYTNTQGTPGSIATRTAAEMFGDDPYSAVGGSYLLRVTNGQGTGTLTITAGSNVTLTGTATVAINTWRDFVVTYTSATALVMQNIATGTFS